MKKKIGIFSFLLLALTLVTTNVKATEYSLSISGEDENGYVESGTFKTNADFITLKWAEEDDADYYILTFNNAPNFRNLINMPVFDEDSNSSWKSGHTEGENGPAGYSVLDDAEIRVDDSGYEEDDGIEVYINEDEWFDKKVTVSVEARRDNDSIIRRSASKKFEIDRNAPIVTITYERFKISDIVKNDFSLGVRKNIEVPNKTPDADNSNVWEVVNIFERDTIEVINSRDDIYEYKIEGQITGSSVDYRRGDFEDLQGALRNIEHEFSEEEVVVYWKDKLGNGASISFYLNITGPSLASLKTKHLDIVAGDEDDDDEDGETGEGVESEIIVGFYEPLGGASVGCTTASTDEKVCSYQLWIDDRYVTNIDYDGSTLDSNNELINKFESSNSDDVDLKIDTSTYGDVRKEYAVRAIDSNGNYTQYNTKTKEVEDIVVPYAVINWTSVTDDSITTEIIINNPSNERTSLKAELYDGSHREKELDISNNNGPNILTFEGLKKRENYEIRIVDSRRDDNPINIRLSKYETKTAANDPQFDVKFSEIISESGKINGKLLVDRINSGDDDLDVLIYKVNSDGDLSSTGSPLKQEYDIPEGTNNIIVLEEMESLMDYRYNYRLLVKDGSDILASYNFRTIKKTPEFEIVVNDVSQSDFTTKILVIDPDGAVDNNSVDIEIYEGRKLIKEITKLSFPTSNKILETFDELTADTKYTVNVYVSYDLKGALGEVEHEKVISKEVYTSKEEPTLEIEDLTSTSDSITFTSKVIDRGDALISLVAVLWENGVETNKVIELSVGTRGGNEFEGLSSDTEYHINFEIIYDLGEFNDRETDFNFFNNLNVSTKKAIPIVDVAEDSIIVTNNSIDLSILLSDTDRSMEKAAVIFYDVDNRNRVKGTPLNLYQNNLKDFSYSNLETNHLYKVVVKVEYKIDGEIEEEILYTNEIRTKKNIAAVIIDKDVKVNSVVTIIEVDNYIGAEVSALLFEKDGTTEIERISLVSGKNDVTFKNLNSHADYKISVESIKDTEKTILSEEFFTTTELLEIPTVKLIVGAPTKDDQVVVTVQIDDPGSTIADDAVATVKVCNVSNPGECIDLNVKNRETLKLPFKKNKFSATIEYDIGNGLNYAESTSKIVERAKKPISIIMMFVIAGVVAIVGVGGVVLYTKKK